MSRRSTVCMFDSLFYFISFRRSDILLEEKPESSLVKNVSFGGHANKEKPHQGTQIDVPHQGEKCTSCNSYDLSYFVCNRNIMTTGVKEFVSCSETSTHFYRPTAPSTYHGIITILFFNGNQESIKRLNPSYNPYSKDSPSEVIFRFSVSCCLNVFVENE